MNEEQAMVAFQIIAAVGTARSNYIEAIQQAKAGDFDSAAQLIKDGDDAFHEGHAVHAKLVADEAAGQGSDVTLLMLHAEDQLMSAEGFKIIANEFIDLYQKLQGVLNK